MKNIILSIILFGLAACDSDVGWSRPEARQWAIDNKHYGAFTSIMCTEYADTQSADCMIESHRTRYMVNCIKNNTCYVVQSTSW